MNTLVKKEIRLLLPSWIVAMLLATVQGITRPYDFYVASLLFFGLTIMALTTIGREASLNTFSSLLAQPAERIQVWKTKLSVLAVAFLLVFAVWLAAFGIASINSRVDVSNRRDAYYLFIAIPLIATATFTGGLWTTLLVRQVASAFWLTLLVPVTLSGFSGIFLAGSESDSLVIAVLSVVIGVYSLAGFLFARWLFFRAQDVGWSGGVIALPDWKFLLAREEATGAARTRRPLVALIKKEIQLQQGVLTSALGLLVLHAGMIGLRALHKFPPNSAGELFTSIWWMFWLVLPALLGSIAIAEERKLGVIESQFCLSASRRTQFAVKACVTLGLGVLLGGVMPILLEGIGLALGSPNAAFSSAGHPLDYSGLLMLLYGAMAFSAGVTVVSVFASSLTKNFLQAIGAAFVTFVGLMMVAPILTSRQMVFNDSSAPHSILPLVIAVPTVVVTLVWLAYLNFKNFRDGWPLWRRNLLGLLSACVVIGPGSAAIYHRAWEFFLPAEPAHRAAKLSLANPPELRNETYENLLVRLPDGRVWFDYLSNQYFPGERGFWWDVWAALTHPLPHSAGPARFISGGNWADASARHVDEQLQNVAPEAIHLSGYAESVGIQDDGTLWASDKSDPKSWTAGKLTQFGENSDWRQFARGFDIVSVLLLKKDGTLWRWGTNHFDLSQWPQNWPGLRAYQPYQIGTNFDWTGIDSLHGPLAWKADGSVWRVWGHDKSGEDKLIRENNYDSIVTQKCSNGFGEAGAYIRNDGTLWVYGQLHAYGRTPAKFEVVQSSRETNWVAVARTWNWMVAIKKDGTLWQWQPADSRNLTAGFAAPPARLGIHHDWISVVNVEGGIVSLAADGSLWFWPDRRSYGNSEFLLRLPKQPRFIANVFGGAN
ncbi:MAG: hypothetical protein ABSH48_10960 [Verrucomicrobiota bacterium]